MLSSGSIPWHNGRYVTPFPSPTHSFFIFARRKGVLASRPLEEKVPPYNIMSTAAPRGEEEERSFTLQAATNQPEKAF